MRRGAGAALVILLAGAAIAVFVTSVTPQGGAREVVASSSPDDADATLVAGDSAAPIFVHVLGQVTNPGLYELRDGDRVVDAVSAAGGFGPTADPAGVNLARLLTDGEQLAVPAVGEVPEAAAPGVASDGRIDLNSADVAALDTLPRIGPAMAQRIVDWRETNGPLASVDDLLAVSGIGPKTVEALRPLVAP